VPNNDEKLFFHPNNEATFRKLLERRHVRIQGEWAAPPSKQNVHFFLLQMIVFAVRTFTKKVPNYTVPTF
jgi:hypothetical protein